MLTFLILCLLVGAVVGFLAGLFGIGGGLVIVPTLVYLLPIMGVPEPLLMSTALGTSFATIVITGFSSAQRHHKLGNVVWKAVKILAPSIMLTVFIFGFFIGKLDRDISSKLFACLVIYLAIKMVLSIKPFNYLIFHYWWHFNWYCIQCRGYRWRRLYRTIFNFTWY